MKPIGPDGFEAMFRANVDPWNYACSPFEAFKRRALLHACGAQKRGRVLELACANGETTRALGPKALRLLGIDGSPTAILEARRRTEDVDRISVRVALLPDAMPRGPFDLILVSELLYYLDGRALNAVLAGLVAATALGGRIVLLHHLRRFEDATQHPRLAHDAARAAFAALFQMSVYKHHGRFELLAFDRGRCSASRHPPGRRVRGARTGLAAAERKS